MTNPDRNAGALRKVQGWDYYVEDAVLKTPDEAISGWLFTPTIPGRPKGGLLARAVLNRREVSYQDCAIRFRVFGECRIFLRLLAGRVLVSYRNLNLRPQFGLYL